MDGLEIEDRKEVNRMVMMNSEHYKQQEVTYFYCYNPRLRKFLNQNGLTWLERGVNENSESPYWTFWQSERLSELIKDYNNKGNQTTRKSNYLSNSE